MPTTEATRRFGGCARSRWLSKVSAPTWRVIARVEWYDYPNKRVDNTATSKKNDSTTLRTGTRSGPAGASRSGAVGWGRAGRGPGLIAFLSELSYQRSM